MSNLDTEITPEADSTPGAPVVTDKLRYVFDDTGVTISTSLVTLFTYSGSGKLFGAVLDFNNVNVQVKLTVDGEVIFDLEMPDLRDVQIPATAGQDTGLYGLEWETAGMRLRFEPKFPMAYDSSILFEAIRLTTPDKSLDRYLIALTKET